jgi:hypothetical protein
VPSRHTLAATKGAPPDRSDDAPSVRTQSVPRNLACGDIYSPGSRFTPPQTPVERPPCDSTLTHGRSGRAAAGTPVFNARSVRLLGTRGTLANPSNPVNGDFANSPYLRRMDTFKPFPAHNDFLMAYGPLIPAIAGNRPAGPFVSPNGRLDLNENGAGHLAGDRVLGPGNHKQHRPVERRDFQHAHPGAGNQTDRPQVGDDRIVVL